MEQARRQLDRGPDGAARALHALRHGEQLCARFSVPPLPPSRAIHMSSVRVGMKEAPRGCGVPPEHARIVMCAGEECVPAALHAHAPAVSRDPVVWESPEPRVVEPDPDLYSLDVMLRRHGMCHGANMMTDHENAMQHAVGRLRRWSI